jgi:hypothetical protein
MFGSFIFGFGISCEIWKKDHKEIIEDVEWMVYYILGNTEQGTLCHQRAIEIKNKYKEII